MIEASGLRKRYGRLMAVDGISFRAEPGEVLGFLGPNGAGKSTTMRMIAGFLAPSEGTAKVCGHDVQDDALAARRALGYLPEGAPSYAEMTPLGLIGFIADLRGLKGAERRARIDFVVHRLALGSVLRQNIDTLSKGFRRRLGLALAILHDPKALILDEPTDSIAARAVLDGMPGVSGFEQNEREARLYVFPQGKQQVKLADAVADRLRSRSVAFSGLRVEHGRLDEVFRRITTTPEAKA